MMPGWLYVLIGGGVGSVCRYALSMAVSGKTNFLLPQFAMFPWGTLSVNLLGCFIIGCLAALPAGGMSGLSTPARLLLVSGFLGGFTTFSAYEYETWELLQANEWLKAGINLFSSMLFGLLGVWVGFIFTRNALCVVVKN